jgi:hypothetical protein
MVTLAAVRRSAAATVAERFGRAVRAASWFAAVGETPTPAERAEASTWVSASDLRDTGVVFVAGWREAAQMLQAPDWSRAWWDGEDNERRRLLDEAERTHGRDAALAALSEVAAVAGEAANGAAAMAAQRAGLADPYLVRVASGSATQAAYLAALAELGGADAEHPFAVKFRLFEAGRWPLAVSGGSFHIF